MKRKSGISLIVITIAVIVMTTISAVVVVSMKNANHIEYANKVVLYSDLKNAKLELSNYISGEELKNPYFDPKTINATGLELMKYIPNLKNEYKDIIQIKEGKMYVLKGTLKYYQIIELNELGIPSI